MIIASWNVRGLGSPLKHRYIVNLLSLHKVSIATFLETKLNSIALSSLMRKKFGNWNFCHNIDPSPTSRILVLWKSDRIDLEVLHTTEQAILCRVKCKITSILCHITFIYGLHSIVRRRPLWSFIDDIAKEISTPWLVVGDFNSIRSPSDKLYGTDVTAYEITDFNNCCFSAGLHDLKSIGAPYSWSNGSIFTRIDRVLVNHAWQVQLPDSYATISNIGPLSDHAEILISPCFNKTRSSKGFKFSNELTLCPDFLPLLRAEWDNQLLYGTKAYVLCKKLKSIKGPLKRLYRANCLTLSDRSSLPIKPTKRLSLTFNILANTLPTQLLNPLPS